MSASRSSARTLRLAVWRWLAALPRNAKSDDARDALNAGLRGAAPVDLEITQELRPCNPRCGFLSFITPTAHLARVPESAFPGGVEVGEARAVSEGLNVFASPSCAPPTSAAARSKWLKSRLAASGEIQILGRARGVPLS